MLKPFLKFSGGLDTELRQQRVQEITHPTPIAHVTRLQLELDQAMGDHAQVEAPRVTVQADRVPDHVEEGGGASVGAPGLMTQILRR